MPDFPPVLVLEGDYTTWAFVEARTDPIFNDLQVEDIGLYVRDTGDLLVNDYARSGKAYLIPKGGAITTYDDRWTGCDASGFMQGSSLRHRYVIGAPHYDNAAFTTFWIYKEGVQVFSRDITLDFADAHWIQACGISPNGQYVAIFARRDTGNYVLVLYEGS